MEVGSEPRAVEGRYGGAFFPVSLLMLFAQISHFVDHDSAKEIMQNQIENGNVRDRKKQRKTPTVDRHAAGLNSREPVQVHMRVNKQWLERWFLRVLTSN